MSQSIYCGTTDFSIVNRHDTNVTVYGNSVNSTITKDFITKLVSNLDGLSVLTLSNITKIEDYALTNLQVSQFELILPDTLEYIGEYAFANCTAMNTIIIPASVTYIGEGAFYGCSSLDYIYFKENIKISYIPAYFCQGGALKGVGVAYDDGTFTESSIITFPDSITTISNNAFTNCSSLGYTIYTNNVTSIGDYAFYGTIINVLNFGSKLLAGESTSTEVIIPPTTSDYDTDRTITTPYTLYLSSKRQFRYHYFIAEENTSVGYLYKLNRDEYEEENSNTYTYKSDDDNFKFCLDSSHIMVFKNGLLLPSTCYYLHSTINTLIDDVGIGFNVPLKAGDRIEIFYVTNDLRNLETDYYNSTTRERYIKNGDIEFNSDNQTEIRVMGGILDSAGTRTNYIKLRSPLYAISSKHSTFVFLNGKKIRLDELEDISDTIIGINTDYSNDSDMNAGRLQVINHLDTQDIIEQLYINDGLSHDESNYKNAFNNGLYKNTNLIHSFSLTNLEAYAERTLLDEILNDLSDTNLNKLFYDYDTATGPMTPYSKANINEPDFANKDTVMTDILTKYYNKS